MRNYSHFIVQGKWIPCSKGDKLKMIEILTDETVFPELAVIAESGQKHIVFRAKRNDKGSCGAGWIQFEEHSMWLDSKELKKQLDIVISALDVFSKAELKSGQYKPHRILKQYGVEAWMKLENHVKTLRGSLFFELILFLAQKREVETNERNSSEIVRDNLEGSGQRVQEKVQTDDMGTIRKHSKRKRVHKQSGEIRQRSLFET
jgi:hypothetical protein